MIASSTAFHYAGCAVGVEVSDEADLTWLREFLVPDFDEHGPAPVVTVSLARDTAAYDACVAHGPAAPSRAISCFGLDGRMASLPAWAVPDAEVVFDEATRTFIRRSREGRRIDLLAPASQRQARVVLLRVIRELAMEHLLNRNAIVLHAAAVSWRGRGYVFAGPKRAGKTTLLLHALTDLGGRQVANDRTTIVANGDRLDVLGLPTLVSVRRSSLEYLGVRVERLRHSLDHHRFALDEIDPCPPTADEAATDLSLTPAQFSRLIGAERSGAQPLAAIWFPHVSGMPGGLTLSRLSPDEASRQLQDVVFRSADGMVVGEHLAASSNRSWATDRVVAMVQTISAHHPCYRCTIGLDAYRDPEEMARLLSA